MTKKKSVFQYQKNSLDSSFIVREYKQEYFNSPYHLHDCYELIIILKSNGKLFIENQVVNFTEGDLFLIGPGISHCFLNNRSFKLSGEKAHALVVFFDINFLGNDFIQSPELSDVRNLLHQSSQGIKFEKTNISLSKKIIELSVSEKLDSLILFLKVLNDLVKVPIKEDMLIKSFPKIINNHNDTKRIEKVIKYIIEHFKEELNINEAAKIACLNHAAFCRYFKRRTEKTFSEFVNNIRITHAKYLLLNQNMSITNICFECGYKNISYFNRQFKKIMNITPLEYRNSNIDSNQMYLSEIQLLEQDTTYQYLKCFSNFSTKISPL